MLAALAGGSLPDRPAVPVSAAHGWGGGGTGLGGGSPDFWGSCHPKSQKGWLGYVGVGAGGFLTTFRQEPERGKVSADEHHQGEDVDS